jgi:hypothetical protein
LKPESKFWQEVKKNITQISFTRLESWASAGVPDLLCYNKSGKFFTIELKVTKKKSLGPLSIKLYEGSSIMKLVNHEPCACVAEGWTKVQEHLVNVT